MAAYVLNTKTSAVTSRDYAANTSIQSAGEVYTASGTGVYKLSAGAPSSILFRTGVKLWGQDNYLRPRYLYIAAKEVVELTVTVELATGSSFDYHAVATSKDLHRVELGRGIKSNYLGFTVKHLGTDTFAFDYGELLGNTLARKV